MAATKKTPSFQKRVKSKILQIPGCRPSIHNNQLLVSTGIPSLDNVIGGGLAVGTVLLVEEDRFSSYSKVVFKYFLAESIVNQHKLFLATSSPALSGQSLLKELPQPITNEPEEVTSSASGEEMKIAWRYRNVSQQSQSSNRWFGNYYDLTKTMDQSQISDCQPIIHDLSMKSWPIEERDMMNPAYRDVLYHIQDEIEKGQFSTNQNPDTRNILRIGLHSLGSPLWNEGCLVDLESGYDPSLCRFLLTLRSLLRSAFAVCMITVPSTTLQDDVFMNRVRYLCDAAVRLESFSGSNKESNPVFKDYHGLFHIEKLARLNSLVNQVPETFDLAFKLKRKKFTIEKLHLPPDLPDTDRQSQTRPQTNTAKPVSMSCSAVSHDKRLDF